MSALATRIKEFDANLEKSEQFIKTATCALAETVQLEMERKQKKRENNEDDSDCDESDPLRQFDAQMALLEGKLMQAKHMASQDNTNEHLHLLGSPTKDYSSSPLLPDKKLQEDDDLIVNAAQNKSYGNVHSTTAIRLVNGGNEELMKTDSCHKLTHKTDQETTW